MTLPFEGWTMKSVLWCVVLVACFCSSTAHGGNEKEHSKLIVVSFDGFRWDYLFRTKTPNFDRLIKNGGYAQYGMKASFITKTFPNHFTLVTGLYEESHGIVANEMFDPELNLTFDSHNATEDADPRWFDTGAEPIWVTNQVQRLDGRSGCQQWPGCAAPIKGVPATRYTPFDAATSNRSRIDDTLKWFTGYAYPINLGLIYFPEPDATAHKFGPDSQQVTDKIAELDEVVGYLLERLEEEDMLENTNVIIVSDHGFTTTSKDQVINLDDYISQDSYKMFSTTPVASILPNDGMRFSFVILVCVYSWVWAAGCG
jgi:ectonucleotide pyrophosphatase/phosphodiesterase family protein 5